MHPPLQSDGSDPDPDHASSVPVGRPGGQGSVRRVQPSEFGSNHGILVDNIISLGDPFHPEVGLMDRVSALLDVCDRLGMKPGNLRFHDLRSRPVASLRAALTRQPHHLAVLTGGDPDLPGRIFSFLRQIDCDLYRLHALYPDGSGSIRIGAVNGSTSGSDRSGSPDLVVLDRREDAPPPEEPRPGIADDTFRRDSDVSMTRRELRLIDLGMLEVRPGHTVWEVGAGTGAISVESARLNPSAGYHAVERDEETFELLKKNIRTHETFNVQPHRGWASEVLEGLPVPDRVFIGGTCGEISAILPRVDASLRRPGLVLANYLALENIETTRDFFDERGYEVTLKRVGLHESRPMGETYTRMAEGPSLELIRARKRSP